MFHSKFLTIGRALILTLILPFSIFLFLGSELEFINANPLFHRQKEFLDCSNRFISECFRIQRKPNKLCQPQETKIATLKTLAWSPIFATLMEVCFETG